MDNFFQKNLQLFHGPIYKDILHYPTFTHLKGQWNDEWYNFIVPNETKNEFEWEKAWNIISEEKKSNVKVTFYLKDTLESKFKKALFSHGYSVISHDNYLLLVRDKKFTLPNYEVELLNENNLDNYNLIAQESFPDWENNTEYATHFFNLSQDKTQVKRYLNVLLKINNNYVAIGNIIIDPELNLAYLHNLGTKEEYRNRGYFTFINQYLINAAIDQNVNNFYALTEEDSPSFLGYHKLGFQKEMQYILYFNY